MSDHPIESMMNTTMEKIKTMVDASTMIGDPITTPDGTVIIPVSKVSYGFASGGSDFVSKNAASKDLFGGGAGAGITLTPVAWIPLTAPPTVWWEWCRMSWIKSADCFPKRTKRKRNSLRRSLPSPA